MEQRHDQLRNGEPMAQATKQVQPAERAQATEAKVEQPTLSPAPLLSPEEFYKQVTQCPDIHAILEKLAKK